MTDKKDKEEEFVKCCICTESLKKDHIGISCAQGHHLCPGDCSNQFVQSRLSEGPLNFLKCPMNCGINVTALSFERQLNENQRETYLAYTAMNELKPDEKLKRCPHCEYFEIWPTELTGMDIFFCHKSDCGICTCAYCGHDIDPNLDNGYTDEDYESGKSNPKTFMHHMECAELAPFLQKFQAAIEEGLGMKCPSCGLIGRKDNACTHINCPKCQCIYCYICGLSVTDCDKEDPQGNIYSHNIDWGFKETRCPMYLIEICEADDRWPEDDDNACATRFSRYKTISHLYDLYREIGKENYLRLMNKYETVKNCGFTIENFEELNEPLIRRIHV